MIVTLIPYCPRAQGQDLGFAYNELMGRLQDDDWACFIDHDACFTTYDWYAQLEGVTAQLREPCLLTARTNRVGSHWQLAPSVDRDNHAMDYHRRVGAALQAADRTSLRDVTNESLMSGVVILLSKRTWWHLGGFARGFLGVDNAIHRVARDCGCRVFLMEGVYVYHWYRADAISRTNASAPCAPKNEPSQAPLFSEGNGDASRTARVEISEIEHARLDNREIAALPDLREPDCPDWGRVPVTGHRILLIGHDIATQGERIRSRHPAVFSVVELDEAAVSRTRSLLGDARYADDGASGIDFSSGGFDAILASGVLEKVPRPGPLFRKMRHWLAPGGRLITSFRTVRSLGIVEALLGGSWSAAAGSDERHRPIRFSTRREVEKLLYRAGFTMNVVQALRGPGHSEWVAGGRSGQVRVGRLTVDGLPTEEAEEFYSRGFLIEATHIRPITGRITSIVIVTFNQIEFTRQCVDSLRRLTDEPYELVFVDNGSTDGTVDYLRSLAGAVLVLNSENRGFPAAANQGIAAARGHHILLLNNDTIVTTGWLRRMLDALNSDPRIGLVGPCSNFVGSDQQIKVCYESLTGLDAFAWEYGKANDRGVVDTHRLIGFCLLIRREVIDAIGLLDERFRVGCFEDDDYCLRAIRAGWRAVIAQDAFVHHFGGRTFAGAGFDLAVILRENEQRFRDKWASDPSPSSPPARNLAAPAGQAVPFIPVAAPNGGLLLCPQRIRISLCMIGRDSAQTLRSCLQSVRPWVDEMVIVDTGSSDETPRIVEEFGGRLFHFPWCDDFSAARNESLRHARGDWILWMDSDDTIPACCGQQLYPVVDAQLDADVMGCVMQVHCPGGCEDGDPAMDMTVVDHVKLIRNRPDLRFEGRIHEQVLPAIRRAGGTVAWTDLYVVHSGSDPSPEAQERKRRRDLHLLHIELRERPDHPFTLFNLGMTYADGGRFEEAVEFLRRGIQHSAPDESHLRKAYALLVYAEAQRGSKEEALQICHRGRELFPNDVELRFREGVILHELGRLAEAAEAYQGALADREARHFSSVDRGLTGYKARQNLAVVYNDMGQLVRAEAQWREVIRDAPGYRAGWRGLGEVLIRGGKFDEARAVADHCVGLPALRVEGCLLRSRLAMASGDIAAAREEIDRANAAAPADRAAMEARCQVLFEHGPAPEAEEALRCLIEKHPADASAHHNLGMLLLRLKRYNEATRAFRQSLRHRADAPATYLGLGYALKESGRHEEAAKAWQQVLRLDPDNTAASAELSNVKSQNGSPNAQRRFAQ